MVVSEKVQRIIDSDGEPGFVCTPAGRMYGRMTHSASSAPFIPPLFPFSFPVPSQQQPAQPEQQQPNPAPNVRLERLTPQRESFLIEQFHILKINDHPVQSLLSVYRPLLVGEEFLPKSSTCLYSVLSIRCGMGMH
eukprot:TRINITY_DN12572_c4_g7_i4.p2 TRINITY_DN12572_c4_g7~~TRINITY_DN12572_c4_g7_i4.p2  ORF type:complete len:136 (+),score=10.86 TRINITY_DN12572_c4_g7_i4:1126-1533(+)